MSARFLFLRQINFFHHRFSSFKEMCQQKEVKAQLLSVLNKEARTKGLHGFEVAKNVYLETESFMAKGILTNTLKMIRFEAKQAYKQ